MGRQRKRTGGIEYEHQNAAALYTTVGAAPLALWTGLAAMQTTTVYAAGRDPDSGTGLLPSRNGNWRELLRPTYKPTGSGGASLIYNCILRLHQWRPGRPRRERRRAVAHACYLSQHWPIGCGGAFRRRFYDGLYGYVGRGCAGLLWVEKS